MCAFRQRRVSRTTTIWAFFRAIYGKIVAGRHFHFDIQCRFLKIPGITLSAVLDTIYLIPEHGALATYVDESLSIGDKGLMDAVSTVMADYKTHRVDCGAIQFAGITAETDASGIHCSARPYADTVHPIHVPARANDKLPSGKELQSLAPKLLWVGLCGRPDMLTNATQLANLQAPTGADAKCSNHTLAILHHRPAKLTSPKLDRASLHIAMYADYSRSTLSAFAKRQVGYLVILTDKAHRFAPSTWRRTAPPACAAAQRRASSWPSRRLWPPPSTSASCWRSSWHNASQSTHTLFPGGAGGPFNIAE